MNFELPEICFKVADWLDGLKLQRRIVCAANKYILTTGEELVIPCVRHANPVLSKQVSLLVQSGVLQKTWCYPDNQGFIDQYYDWWNRVDAFVIAENANQINYERNGHHRELFSEGLY